MSKEQRKLSEVTEKQDLDPAAEPVSFESWFTVKMKGHAKLRAHHLPVLQAYFSKNSLSDSEPESEYDAMLKRYGY